MSVALFIVAEREVEGLDTFVNGKALATCRPAGAKRSVGDVDHLGALAQAAGVRPLMEFFSETDESTRALDEEGLPEDFEPPPEEWRTAAEGLTTARGLLAHLTANPDAAADVDRLIEDLRRYEEVLGRLEADRAIFLLRSKVS